MSYKSKVLCDGCHVEVIAPQDGGFPFGWCEINAKPSLRGPASAAPHKRTRFHLCDSCSEDRLGDVININFIGEGTGK